MERNQIPVANRAANIEYAIRDVVVPATELESQGHKILKLNIGDPIAYPDFQHRNIWLMLTLTLLSRMAEMDTPPPMGCQNLEQQLLKMNVKRLEC